jgi:hypothetical protein
MSGGGGNEGSLGCAFVNIAPRTCATMKAKGGKCVWGLEKMHLGFGDVDGGINATGANDLGGVGGGRSGGGGGGLARGAFHAETAARPATSDAVVP